MQSSVPNSSASVCCQLLSFSTLPLSQLQTFGLLQACFTYESNSITAETHPSNALTMMDRKRFRYARTKSLSSTRFSHLKKPIVLLALAHERVADCSRRNVQTRLLRFKNRYAKRYPLNDCRRSKAFGKSKTVRRVRKSSTDYGTDVSDAIV